MHRKVNDLLASCVLLYYRACATVCDMCVCSMVGGELREEIKSGTGCQSKALTR